MKTAFRADSPKSCPAPPMAATERDRSGQCKYTAMPIPWSSWRRPGEWLSTVATCSGWLSPRRARTRKETWPTSAARVSFHPIQQSVFHDSHGYVSLSNLFLAKHLGDKGEKRETCLAVLTGPSLVGSSPPLCPISPLLGPGWLGHGSRLLCSIRTMFNAH